jgi:glycosyltransferase involved in cell wall biosynthesis
VPEPVVSVVVPTRSRPARLERLLEGLREQTLEPSRFEVIVVGDGASPETYSLLERERARGGLELRVVERALPGGPSAARNSGWQVARAPLVAFIDDDCRPVADWLAAGTQASDPLSVVQGATYPDPDDSHHAGIFSRTVEVQALGPQFETCNIFYPREALDQLGGFDERYGITPGGEDTDLAWRAIEAGYTPAFAPHALVYHAVDRLGPAGMLRVAARWSEPMRVFAAHPQARQMLYRGVFWNVWHYLVWRSILALAAPSVLRRVLITLHLLELRKRARREGSGARAIPFLLVHDLVECWAVARGAVRNGTLVL